MADKIDKYAQKLAEKFNISYENTRELLEENIYKLEDSKKSISNIPKYAYKTLSKEIEQNGGSILNLIGGDNHSNYIEIHLFLLKKYPDYGEYILKEYPENIKTTILEMSEDEHSQITRENFNEIFKNELNEDLKVDEPELEDKTNQAEPKPEDADEANELNEDLTVDKPRADETDGADEPEPEPEPEAEPETKAEPVDEANKSETVDEANKSETELQAEAEPEANKSEIEPEAVPVVKVDEANEPETELELEKNAVVKQEQNGKPCKIKECNQKSRDFRRTDIQHLKVKFLGCNDCDTLTKDSKQIVAFTKYLKKDLDNERYKLSNVKNAGFSAKLLKKAGFTAKKLKEEGEFTATQLKQVYTLNELIKAGFTFNELRNEQFTEEQLKQKFTFKNLTEDNLETLVRLILMNQLTVEQLKSVNYTSEQLKTIAKKAEELHRNNLLYTRENKKQQTSGGPYKFLIRAGFNLIQLKNLNFPLKELKKMLNLKKLKALGYTATDLKNEGYILTGRRFEEFTLNDLLLAGYTAKELRNAGFTVVKRFKENDFSLDEIIKAGFEAKKVKANFLDNRISSAIREISSEYNEKVKDLSEAFTKEEVDAELKKYEKEISEGKYSLEDERKISKSKFSLLELMKAGFLKKEELIEAGFTTEIVEEVLKIYEMLYKRVGHFHFDRNLSDLNYHLKEKFTANKLKEEGFSLEELIKVGYTANKLKEAGFSLEELIKANDLKFPGKDLIDAGFAISEKFLKENGYTASDFLKNEENAVVEQEQTGGFISLFQKSKIKKLKISYSNI